MAGHDDRARLRRRLTFVGVVIFFGGVAIAFRAVLLPFVVGAFMTFVMEPVVSRLAARRIRRKPVPRWVAVLTVYFTFFVMLGLAGAYIGPKIGQEAQKLVDDAPRFFQRVKREWIPEVNEFLRGLRRRFTSESRPRDVPAGPWRGEFQQVASRAWEAVRRRPPRARDQVPALVARPQPGGGFAIQIRGVAVELTDLGQGRYQVQLQPPEDVVPEPEEEEIDVEKAISARLRSWVDSLGARVVDYVTVGQSVVTGIAGGLGLIALTFVIAAFLSIDLQAIHRFFRSLVPRGWADDYDELISDLEEGLAGVIRGQLVICLINGMLTAIGLYFLGVPYAGIWSLLAAAMSLIPIFGTVLSSAPMIGVSLFTTQPVGVLGLHGIGLALAVLAWILLIHFMEANILEPKIVGKHARIHPVLILFALLAGQHLYGIAGLVFAVPALSIVQTFFLFFKDRLYGERPPPPPETAEG